MEFSIENEYCVTLRQPKMKRQKFFELEFEN